MQDVEAFAREVRDYCDFVEKASTYDLEKRLSAARRRLLALYEAALSLPEGEHRDEGEVGRVEGLSNWDGFGEKDRYWECFDPYVDDDRVVASLSDDVLDVYADVRRGLAYWDAGYRARAIWEWHFLFDAHWGDHAIDALRALHRACRTD